MEGSISEDKICLERTKELVLLLHKTFNTMRIFPPDHPSWRKFQKDLADTFEAYLDMYGELALKIEESQLFSQGSVIYEEKMKRHSLTFMLHIDGVREIVFEAGLASEELQGFIDTLIENSRLPEEERDIVCLLWERNFPHIHYFTVEDLPDPETAALMSELMKGAKADQELPPKLALTSQDQGRYERGKIASLEKMSRVAYLAQWRERFEQPESEMTFAFDDQRETNELLELVEKESAFDPNREMAHFLLEILHKEGMSEKHGHYVRLSDNFLEKLLSLAEFAVAGQFLRGLMELAEALRPQSPEQAERIDGPVRRMSSREKIEGLERVINEGLPFDPEDLYQFLLLLEPRAIDPLCDLLGRIGSPQMRSCIFKGLERLAREHQHILAQKVRDAPPGVARGLLTIVGNIGDRKIVPYLKPHALERNSKLRYDTIHALRKIGGEEANAVFIQLLDDPDPDIRTAAARSLDLSGELTAGRSVLTMTRQKNFKKRSFIEKKALLEYLGGSRMEEGLPLLRRLLKRGSWLFPRRNTDTRVCAALGLGKFGSQEAFDALREQIRSRNPLVRETCTAILRGAGELDDR